MAGQCYYRHRYYDPPTSFFHRHLNQGISTGFPAFTTSRPPGQSLGSEPSSVSTDHDVLEKRVFHKEYSAWRQLLGFDRPHMKGYIISFQPHFSQAPNLQEAFKNIIFLSLVIFLDLHTLETISIVAVFPEPLFSGG